MAFKPPYAVLRSLVRWWRSQNVRGIIIGGIAASLLGRPRVTRDVDALVLLDQERWKAFLESGKRCGFVPRIKNAVSFAQTTRVLLVRHKPTGIDVDISFGVLPFEKECIKRAKREKVAGVQILLPSPEDLIIMKAIAHRPRDMADIESILDVSKKLDVRRIRRWVEEFSRVLEMPEISHDLESVLSAKRKKPKRKAQG